MEYEAINGKHTSLKYCQCHIAVATTEADEAIASSDLLKIMGISTLKGANRGDSGQF